MLICEPRPAFAPAGLFTEVPLVRGTPTEGRGGYRFTRDIWPVRVFFFNWFVRCVAWCGVHTAPAAAVRQRRDTKRSVNACPHACQCILGC